jgi:hypothetical protein
MPHKITLSNVAAVLLRSCLEAPGWATSPRTIVAAASLLDRLASITLPSSLANVKTQRDAVASPDYLPDELALTLSEIERETGKAAISAACSKGYLSAGPVTVELFEPFGVE